MAHNRTYYVFYSWQSLRANDNKELIRTYINDVISKIRSDKKYDIQLLEATTQRHLGAVDIPHSILSNISQSDVFIGDISVVNGTCPTCKKTINANVAIELGFASASLGWERIMLLFNTEFHAEVDSVPFDIKHRRISKFKLSKKNQGAKGQIMSDMESIITHVIENNPTRLLVPSSTSVERCRDVNTIEDLLSSFSCSEMDEFCSEYPNFIKETIVHYSSCWQGRTSESLFHINDPKLKRLLIAFVNAWSKSTRHGGDYFPAENRKGYYQFGGLYGDVFENAQSETTFHKITTEVIAVAKPYKRLITYLKENYKEIDMYALSP